MLVGLADEGGFPHPGVIVFQDNEVDSQTGTIRTRAKLDNHDRAFTPGLFARVRLLGDKKYDALLINDSAVGTDQTVKFVLVVGADNKVEYRPVKLGPVIDGLRVVREGLKENDTVVVNGLQRVRPGSPVTPQKVAMGEQHIHRAARPCTLKLPETSSETVGLLHRPPIFAAVLSAFITIGGAIALFKLPISEYPEVVPPTIVVRATYPGANPKTIAETVASPLEQAINGVEDSLYMFSQATMRRRADSDRDLQAGHRLDQAQVQVQNRVSQALPKLPEEVRDLGVTTTKQSPDLTMVVHLFSPDGRYDEVVSAQLRALCRSRTCWRASRARVTCSCSARGDYAMRVWLDPDKLAARNLTASDVVAAIREQNVQVAAGQIGAPPSPTSQFQIAGERQRPAALRGGIRRHHRQDRRQRRKNCSWTMSRGLSWARSLLAAFPAEQQNGGGHPDFPDPGRQRPGTLQCMSAARWRS